MNGIKNGLAECMTQGHIFAINIDDSDVNYPEVFDPDIRDFYDPSHFPSFIMRLNELANPEIHSKILQDTEFEGQQYSDNFQVFIWSKYKIDEKLDNEQVINKFKYRFGQILNLPKIDLILYVKEEEIVKEEEEEEVVEEEEILEDEEQ